VTADEEIFDFDLAHVVLDLPHSFAGMLGSFFPGILVMRYKRCVRVCIYIEL
jgi:hypothetical protein